MLDKVNYNFGVNFSSTNFKGNDNKIADNKCITEPCFDNEQKGMNTLAVYNRASINNPLNFSKLDVIPHTPINIAPEDISSIGGEEILTSDGKRHSIVKNNGTSTITYIFNKENADKISSIEERDNNTGRLLKEQINKTEEKSAYNPFDTEVITISEYNKFGKETACTRYENGKMVYTDKTAYKPNGNTVTIMKFDDGSLSIDEHNNKKNVYRHLNFDKNKQIQDYYEDRDIKNKRVTQRAEFYNGALIGIEKSVHTTVPNTMGSETLNAPELIPAEKFISSVDYKGMNGEKTYYSNGAIETNLFNTQEGDVKAHFAPNGVLEKLSFSDKDIEFKEKSQTITEHKENGDKKITTYDGNKLSMVRYESNGKYKQIYYSEKQIPEYYEEDKIETNYFEDNGSDRHCISFNNIGMVLWAH